MARLSEHARYMPFGCELVWIDNGTKDDDGNMKWWKEHFPKPLQFYQFSENVGFSNGSNMGGKIAKGKYLLFCNNDVIVRRPFVDEVCSMIGNNDTIIVTGRIVDWPGGWNEIIIAGEKYVIPYAEGWFMGMTSEAWKKLGGYDPIFSPYDCEDLDISLNALSKGFNFIHLSQGYLEHIGGGTFQAMGIRSEYRRTITEQNIAKLHKKWEDKIPSILSPWRQK